MVRIDVSVRKLRVLLCGAFQDGTGLRLRRPSTTPEGGVLRAAKLLRKNAFRALKRRRKYGLKYGLAAMAITNMLRYQCVSAALWRMTDPTYHEDENVSRTKAKNQVVLFWFTTVQNPYFYGFFPGITPLYKNTALHCNIFMESCQCCTAQQLFLLMRVIHPENPEGLYFKLKEGMVSYDLNSKYSKAATWRRVKCRGQPNPGSSLHFGYTRRP
jgi:hypothetical protein